MGRLEGRFRRPPVGGDGRRKETGRACGDARGRSGGRAAEVFEGIQPLGQAAKAGLLISLEPPDRQKGHDRREENSQKKNATEKEKEFHRNVPTPQISWH